MARNLARALDRFFGIREAGSTLPREVLGGVTSFVTMSYIVFVQPAVLAAAGMPFGGVLIATCLSSALACLLMGLIARYPFALAPGMGENFLFAFTVCGTAAMGGMGFSWQAGLAIVLISGVLFLGLSLLGLRERIVHILPDCLKNAIGPAIGFFIAYVGFQWGGIIVGNTATLTALGDLTRGAPLLTLFGVLLIAVLMTWRVPGGILIGILATAVLCLATGVIPWRQEPLNLSLSTVGQLEFRELIDRWDAALMAILLFFFLDLFDTVGTLVGVSRQAGYLQEDGTLPRAGKAFFCDAAGTCAGALLGTSTVTSYIESATGVAAGARTGLASVVTGLCFLCAVVMAPLIHVTGQNIGPEFYGTDSPFGFVAMYPAVAPALIVVGFLMMAPLQRVAWDDLTESLPAFFTVALMVFGYGITEGVAMGVISFALIKLLTGRSRQVHPVLYVLAAALVLRYAFLT